MTALEVYDIIRLSSEFSTVCTFTKIESNNYVFAEIIYNTKDNQHNIKCQHYNDKIYFYINSTSLDIKSIDSIISLKSCNNTSIIKYFKKFLIKCDKLDYFLKVKELDKIKIKLLTNKYIIKHYNLNINFEFYSYYAGSYNNFIIINYQKTKIKNLSYNTKFDVTKEKNARYAVDIYFNIDDVQHTISFYYENKLILHSKVENYTNKKDITTIIRKERLLNLIKNE